MSALAGEYGALRLRCCGTHDATARAEGRRGAGLIYCRQVCPQQEQSAQALPAMVLLEQVGGVRERQIFLYFWDERDGPNWSGWWITYQCEHSAATAHASDASLSCICSQITPPKSGHTSLQLVNSLRAPFELKLVLHASCATQSAWNTPP
eukprot:6200160-Pleurochrysis_carterae.AAC.4